MKGDDNHTAGGENDEAVIEIIGINYDGEGVRRTKGYTFFSRRHFSARKSGQGMKAKK